MRKTFIISIFILTFCLLPKIADAGIILRPVFHTGLIGYWDFQEGAGNKAYNKSRYDTGDDMTLTNMAENDWVDGKIGKALDFDGIDDFASISSAFMPTARGFRTTGLTISAWYKGTNITGGVTTQGYGNHGWGSYGLYINAGKAMMSAYNSGVEYVQATSPLTYNDNNWHYFVGVVDEANDSVRIYVDGGEKNASPSWPDSADYEADESAFYRNFTIGALQRDPSTPVEYFLSGRVDEVRIYNRTLSASEIQRLYKLSQPKMLAPTKTGLVGYWSFDEGTGTKVGDMSNNGNHGTWSGTGSHWTTGKFGNGGNFNGSDDYVEVIEATQFDLSDFTYSVWAKTDNTTSWRTIIDVDNDEQWLGFNATTGTVHISGRCGYDPGAYGTIVAGTWYHLVWTVSGSNFKIYINGSQEGSGAGCSSSVDADRLMIGAGGPPAYDERFNGLLDEVRVYNRTLETSEITALYKSGLSKINASQNNQLTSGLVGLWSFNGPDMDGNTAIDRSGQGNNGTLSYGPTRAIGKVGQALQFDGDNDYVDFGSASAISNFDEFSIVLWAYFNSPFDDESGIVYHIADYYSNSGFWFWTWTQTNFEMGARDSGDVEWGSVNPDVTTDTWTHLVVTWKKNDKFTLYKNGKSVGTVSTPNVDNITNATSTLLLGYSPQNSDSWLNAKIDEFRLYNRALSAQEIQRLYNLGR